MPFPIVYRKSSESSTNYDWIDLAAGNGYVTFYAAKDGFSYILTNSNIYSDEITHLESVTTGLSKVFDQTFTTTINSPRTINGTVFADIQGTVSGGVSGNADSCYFNVKLIKVVGTTETIIGQMSGATLTAISTVAAANDHENSFLISIPVTNYLIKKGEKLGIRLEGYAGKSDAGAGHYFLIGLDPKNRTSILTNHSLLTTTVSTVNIPFRIDL